RNSYSSDRESLDEQQSRILSSFHCRMTDEVERTLWRVDDKKRCLIDVDSGDRRKWSALAMYEFYKPGFVSYFDVPSRHLAANRLFVDLEAEASAIESM